MRTDRQSRQLNWVLQFIQLSHSSLPFRSFLFQSPSGTENHLVLPYTEKKKQYWITPKKSTKTCSSKMWTIQDPQKHLSWCTLLLAIWGQFISVSVTPLSTKSEKIISWISLSWPIEQKGEVEIFTLKSRKYNIEVWISLP